MGPPSTEVDRAWAELTERKSLFFSYLALSVFLCPRHKYSKGGNATAEERMYPESLPAFVVRCKRLILFVEIAGGAFRISAEDMVRIGEPLTAAQWPAKYGGGYVGYVEVLHQLHCLV